MEHHPEPTNRPGPDARWRDAAVDEATGRQMLLLLASVGSALLSRAPGISVVGVAEPRTLCARPGAVDRLDLQQIGHGGPTMETLARGAASGAVLSEHVDDWRELERLARASGYASIHAFPILGPVGTLGALSVYAASDQLVHRDVATATTLVTAAASVMIRTRTRDGGADRVDQDAASDRVGELRRDLDRIGADLDDLFVRYFAIGGANTRSHVTGVMAGGTDVTMNDLDTLALAVEELLADHVAAHRPRT